MIRILIADDHDLLREGLEQALGAVPDIQVLGTASSGAELLSVLDDVSPDVIMVDVYMPGMSGLEALGKMRGGPPAIVVTMHESAKMRKQAMDAGAVGFLSKSTPLPRLAAAMRAAVAGESFIDDDYDVTSHMNAVLDPGAAALTARERELLSLLATGVSSTDELAEKLYISQKTVKNHLASIYDKLAVSDRAQAAVEAIRLGL
ncbi:MAG: response regulator transcription factor [Acidimicrobiia bacterium]|nr:response regulator transcription factor [Acidimicrobiia bacterium]